MEQPIGEMDGIAVSEGFGLVPLMCIRSRRGFSGRTWVRMNHRECAAEVDFVHPTQMRVRFYERAHDCDAILWM